MTDPELTAARARRAAIRAEYAEEEAAAAAAEIAENELTAADASLVERVRRTIERNQRALERLGARDPKV